MKPQTRYQPNLLKFQLNLTEEALKETQNQPRINADNLLLNLEELKSKSSALLSSLNDPIKEKSFRQTCSFYSEHSIDNPELYEAYQEYVKSYNKITSLYLFDGYESDESESNYESYESYESIEIYESDESDESSKTDKIEIAEKVSSLWICNMENEKEEIIAVETPEFLSRDTCITQLPNGELFCLGKSKKSLSETALIINSDYKAHRLPSYTSCYASPPIYFNRSIYCFGGYDSDSTNLALSRRFDLDRNRWVKLTPMPKADRWCYSVVFNGNILISGYENRNLLIYSVDIDSYSTVLYDFEYYKEKIVINADGILFLISGKVYKSTDGYTWERISESWTDITSSNIYWVYNNGGIYKRKQDFNSANAWDALFLVSVA